MTSDTSGLEIRSRSRWMRETVELVSSMRFAIALLTLICIASVIGTVVKQHEPLNNYVNQFGPFWAGVFDAVGLYTVYSARWFLLILALLVLSTSLCIARNAPKILHELKTYKEQVREQALQAFHHKGAGTTPETQDQALARISTLLGGAGWKARTQVREQGVMIAARKGMANKIGYLAAHSSIVLICIGGALDGDLVLRAQMALFGKKTFAGTDSRAVTEASRLSANNPTFRGNLFVPEGSRAGTAVLNLPDGVLLQELPFDVELKKFIVEYYETGMPKLFASEIVIHDRDTKRSSAATVRVNQPVIHRGVAIYQSSFDDGGSQVKLHAVPMNGAAGSFDVQGSIGGSTQLSSGEQKLTLEFAGLRVINVENLGGGEASGADVRKVDLGAALAKHLGSGAKSEGPKTLRNVGPSVSYRLRDASGQAREFNNYMVPVELEGQRVLLAGVRDGVNDSFRYLRIPVDEKDSVDGWARLRAALASDDLRRQAVARYVTLATPVGKPGIGPQLQLTAQRVLGLFAGADRPPGARAPGGLQALSDFIEGTVAEADRPRISEVLLRILNGCLFELNNLARQQAGLPPLEPGEKTQAFMSQAVVSLSDSFFYPAPVLLQLADFKQVQASVFQVARAPGKTLVYLGAVLLIVGVFAMLYIRERRLWIWLQAEAAGGSRLTLALSTTRRTLDVDAEFERLKQGILEPRLNGGSA